MQVKRKDKTHDENFTYTVRHPSGVTSFGDIIKYSDSPDKTRESNLGSTEFFVRIRAEIHPAVHLSTTLSAKYAKFPSFGHST